MHCILIFLWDIARSATFWTAVAAIAVAFYTYYARQQWKATAANLSEAKRAADAAQEALQISRDELRISVRPWVGISDEPMGVQTTPITFDEHGNATMQHSITVKNYSSNAAQNIMTIAVLMVTEDLEAIKKGQQEISGDNFVGKTDMGFLLFPGKDRLANTSASRYERSLMVSKSHTGKFEAFLVGCIGYRDQFGFLYHTRFIYWLVEPKSGLPIEFDAVPNSEVRGVFMPWHTSIDAPEHKTAG
jgi:hypothetical protein